MMNAAIKAHLSFLAIFAAAGILYFFPPETYHFYPRCPVFQYLHIYCPGCGATRAVAALLHGRIRAALQYNALAVFLSPPALYCLGKIYVRILRGQSFSWPQPSLATVNIILFTAFLFGVIRNTSHFVF